MILLGFGGYAFSGKDTAADSLLVRSDMRWEKLYMSQTLERALLALNPIIHSLSYLVDPKDPDSCYVRYRQIHAEVGYDKSKEHPEVRALLQRLGTEVGRNLLGENVWVDAVFGEADKLMAEGTNVSVCGIRYPNELAAVHDRSGTSVWVDRGLPPVNSHTSDNTLVKEDFDYVLDNRGSIQDLAKNVRDLVAYIEEQQRSRA